MYVRLIIGCFALLFLLGCEPDPETYSEDNDTNIVAHKKSSIVEVYTTAKDTSLRLARTESADFEPAIQPLETEVAVFVNPNKRFQSILGFEELLLLVTW